MDLIKESETLKGRTASFFSPDQSRSLDRNQFVIKYYRNKNYPAVCSSSHGKIDLRQAVLLS